MIERWLNRFFPVKAYPNTINRYRAWMVYATTVILTVLYLAYALFVKEWALADGRPEDATMLQSALYNPFLPQSLAFYFILILNATSYELTRRGKLHISQWLPPTIWYFGGVLLAVTSVASPAFAAVNALVFVMLAGLLIGQHGLWVATGISLVTMILGFIADPTYVRQVGEPSIENLAAQLIGGALLVYLFLRFANVNRSEGATEIMQDSSITAAVLRQIAQQVALRVTPQKLLSDIVTKIEQAFPYLHHVQVFLLSDDGSQAELAASSGDIGQALIEQGYMIPLGTQSIISQVIETGASVLEGANGTRGRSERLETTSVQIVFPLRIGLKVLGALDIQSPDATAFSDFASVATFQALSDSLALAIDNVTQYQRAEARLRDNESLVNEARVALQEVERLNDRLTGRAWAEYLQNVRQDIGTMVDFEADMVQSQFEPTPTLQDAIMINQVVEERHDGVQVIAVPLRVRGQVVGAMEFELDSTQLFSPEDLDLLQEVGERFGMAVENARLVDESQRLARREALVSQITSRLQSTNDIETMLNEAARSLRDVLNAERVSIRLGTPPVK
jgi:GAF domain-containing protein